MGKFWKVQVENRVALVKISNPTANALSRPVLDELEECLAEWENDPAIKVIVLTGEGRFFCAGADIKEFASMDSKEAKAAAERGQSLFNRLESYCKPVIAAINGACLGGGLELAMACHIRLAAFEAKLGLPELNLGIIPGYGGTQRLPRLIGRGRAARLILSSCLISGEEAGRIGLADAAYPGEQLLEEAKRLAQAISEKSAVAVRLALEAIRASAQLSPEEGYGQEAELFGQAFLSEDRKEGVAAFLEKRKPCFSDR
mgnify:CR=1 FL=1